ncbi:phage tail tube protein [Nonomuraea sp. NPDC001684]
MGSENVFIPQQARLWLAPVGTAAPEGPTVTMPSAWYDIGLFTPDSFNWATDPSFEETRAHQSNYAVRRWQTEDAATIEVDLLEWTAASFRAVYGGGVIEKVTPEGGGAAYFKFTPPAIGGRTETAACLELIDGTKKIRRMVPRCEQAEGVEQSFQKTEASTLPLRLSVLGGDIGAPYYDLISGNWAAFDPTPPSGS